MLKRQPITVSIIARLPVQRYGLGAVVEKDPDLVCGLSVPSPELLATGPGQCPHVVLYHLDGRAEAAGESVRALVGPELDVIVLVGRSSARYVASMIRGGVRGAVGKDADRRELSNAIKYVASGTCYVSPSVSDQLPPGPAEVTAELLTSREQEILVRVADGDTDQQIARMLQIEVRTVRSHLDNIRNKTGERRRPDLTRFAITRGLWPPRREMGSIKAPFLVTSP
ncbi:MAG: response regulator transcription factor [Nocardioides sp.]